MEQGNFRYAQMDKYNNFLEGKQGINAYKTLENCIKYLRRNYRPVKIYFEESDAT